MLAPAFPAARHTGPARPGGPSVPAAAVLAALVAALLGALTLAVLVPLPASAASQLAGQVRRADDVFTGTVTGSTTARKSHGQRGATTTYDLEVGRVYKGRLQQQSVQVTVDASTRSCRLGALQAHQRYLVLATRSGQELTTDGCSGTGRATATLVGDVEKLLGDGRPPVPPAPRKATFTPVAHHAPTSFPRLAAPGAAAVLVGLLGFVVVRRLARRS